MRIIVVARLSCMYKCYYYYLAAKHNFGRNQTEPNRDDGTGGDSGHPLRAEAGRPGQPERTSRRRHWRGAGRCRGQHAASRRPLPPQEQQGEWVVPWLSSTSLNWLEGRIFGVERYRVQCWCGCFACLRAVLCCDFAAHPTGGSHPRILFIPFFPSHTVSLSIPRWVGVGSCCVRVFLCACVFVVLFAGRQRSRSKRRCGERGGSPGCSRGAVRGRGGG